MNVKATAQASSVGIGFLPLLTVLFIGLKLTGYIAWSWWWVLSPLWIPFAVMVMVVFGVLAFVGLSILREGRMGKGRKAKVRKGLTG